MVIVTHTPYYNMVKVTSMHMREGETDRHRQRQREGRVERVEERERARGIHTQRQGEIRTQREGTEVGWKIQFSM